MFQGTIDENVRVLRELLDSSQHRVFALTNWSRETFPIAKSLFPFFNEFEGAVVSGEEGLIKPDPEIYKLLLRKYNLIPENSVFIDDRLENVEAARALNIHGIHYQHPVISLREELSGLVF